MLRKLVQPNYYKFGRFVNKDAKDSLKFLDDYIENFEKKKNGEPVKRERLSEEVHQKMDTFLKLGIHGALCKTLIEDMHFEKPTEIQQKVIPYLLNKRSVIASSETGSGKTASYLLPIIQHVKQIMKQPYGGISALIMCPTKELVNQIFEQYQKLVENFEEKPKAFIITGKKTVNYLDDKWYQDLNVVIATPGKVIELLHKKKGNQPFLDLSKIKYFVLDECDKMLDLGFLPDLLEIHSHLLRKELTVALFSATLIPGLESFMKKIVGRKHNLVNLNKDMHVASSIKHIQYMVSHSRKKLKLLEYLLRRKAPFEEEAQILIFCRTQRRADRIVETLSKKYKVASIHADKGPGERKKMIRDFKSGELRILVSTDVLARGIDILSLKYVINFDLPSKPESYLHRVGRCGRAGNEGFAISFVSQSPQIIKFQKGSTEINELHYVKDIENFLKEKIELRKVPGPWNDHENLSKDTPEKLEAIKQSQEAALEILKKKTKNSSVKDLKRLIRKKRADGVPTLRNFQEGRYEDVLHAFEIKSAKKKGILFKEK